MRPLGSYNRSVSIIGVGCTPFMYTMDNPETNGLTEGEMFGYAALKAMEDAGVYADSFGGRYDDPLIRTVKEREATGNRKDLPETAGYQAGA